MKRVTLVSVSLLGLVAAAAFAQVSEEEAMQRLKEKQAAREHAASQPGTPADPSDVAMLRSMLKDLRKENLALRDEVANLKAENADLLKQVIAHGSGPHVAATAPAGKSIFETDDPGSPAKK